jgi:nitrate reductase gamma subunit
LAPKFLSLSISTRLAILQFSLPLSTSLLWIVLAPYHHGTFGVFGRHQRGLLTEVMKGAWLPTELAAGT